MAHKGKAKLFIGDTEVGTCSDINAQLEDRTRECRETDVELTMRNMADFFGAEATPVEFTLSREPEESNPSVEDLLAYLRSAAEELAGKRVQDIREVVTTLNPGVDQDTLDRITPFTLILVPLGLFDTDKPLRDFIRPTALVSGTNVVLILDTRKSLLNWPAVGGMN